MNHCVNRGPAKQYPVSSGGRGMWLCEGLVDHRGCGRGRLPGTVRWMQQSVFCSSSVESRNEAGRSPRDRVHLPFCSGITESSPGYTHACLCDLKQALLHFVSAFCNVKWGYGAHFRGSLYTSHKIGSMCSLNGSHNVLLLKLTWATVGSLLGSVFLE